MLRNYVTAKLTENLEFRPTRGQAEMIGELAGFLASDLPSEIMLVKGYAGTGKTTLVNSLVRTLHSMKLSSVLLAPTGRAAKVMQTYTGAPAWTIHKKIYRQKSGKDGLGEFVLDRNLHRDTYFIVDEASMIGEGVSGSLFGTGDLLRDLLDYVGKGVRCRLILVGDTAQLPPVGLDISPALDPARLQQLGYAVRSIEMTDVVRQSEGSGILHNATLIRQLISSRKTEYPAFHFDAFSDISLLSGVELLEAIGTSYERHGVGETMIVTRSNKRANRFNAGIRSQILWREEEITPGDLLMVVKNNYFWKDGENRIDFIANGDIIRVERMTGSQEVHGHRFADLTVSMPDYGDLELEVKVLLDVLDLDAPSLSQDQHRTLYASVAEDYPDASNRRQMATRVAGDPYYNALQVKFAYAVTCHKSQGGQWKSVFLDQGYFTDEMLSLDYLRWMYTAFTRATDHLYLVNLAREFMPR